jgi:hypothetical protein
MGMEMRAIIPLIAALLITSPLHAEEKLLMGCWAQDETGVVRNPDETYTTYEICFLPGKRRVIHEAAFSQPISEIGNKRQVDTGSTEDALAWSASQNKIRFTPISRGGDEFSCDFTLSDKLTLSNCGNDWNGPWVFDSGLTKATNQDEANRPKH